MCCLVFEVGGTDVAERRVTTPAVVEGLDIVEDGGARRVSCGEFSAVDELDLERRKEALRDRVVPAVALAAHAADEPSPPELALVVVARGTGTTVGKGGEAGARGGVHQTPL